MSPACQRWVELSDRRAVGETLSAEEREFQEVHAASCPTCREESDIWRAISEPPLAVPSEREIDAVLLGARRLQSPAFRLQRGAVVAAAAATLACAAAVALWIALRPARDGASVTQGAASAAPTMSQAVIGTAPMPRAEPADEMRSEPGCSEVVAGITVCVASGTRIGSLVVNGAERTISLTRGRAVVSLVPQPPGTTFSVTTPSGRVTAVGTIFSVEVDAGGAAIVRVSEGRVLVRAEASAATRALRAGETLPIGADTPRTLLAADRERDLALLPPALRAHAQATNDATAPSTSGTQRASQDELLDQAQALRARGEFRRAVELYRKIYELSPGSASGRAALVAQGELQLSSLGDPQGALKAFNTYLARGGALAQEASFGKARALRALGRQAEERQTIERFIATYPEAPQSRVLRRRLAELE